MSGIESQDNALIAQLKSEYGLRCDPFSRSVSDFYGGGQRQHNLETLRHLSIFGDMVLLLTGEKGAGKTRLLEEFSSTHRSELNFFHISAGLNDVKQSLLTRMLLLSSLPAIENESPAETLERLIGKYQQEFRESGRRVLWVFDDADLLADDELTHLLSKFQVLPPESGVVLLLSGLPSLVDRISLFETPQHEEWLHQLHLKPFSEQEMHEYLTLRLVSAGMSGDLVLSDVQLMQLMELGKGLPGRIHRVFSAIALGVGGGEKESVPEKSKDRAAQYVLFSVAGLLFLSFLFVSYQHGFFGGNDVKVDSVQSVRDEFAAKNKALAEERERTAQRVAERLAKRDDLKLDFESSDKALTEGDSGQDVAVYQEQVVETVLNNEVATDEVGDQPELKTEELNSVKEVVVDSVPESEPVEAIATAETEKVVKNRHSSYRGPEWLQSRAPDRYTLQVLGSHNEETAIRYLEALSEMPVPSVYVETRYKDKPWFVVLYGDFGAKSEAREASKNAPKAIKKQNPWLRSFQSVVNSLP